MFTGTLILAAIATAVAVVLRLTEAIVALHVAVVLRLLEITYIIGNITHDSILGGIMKLRNVFAFIFLMLGATGALAEYDKVLCPSGTTPVRVPGGWQCQTANPGEPSVVYPKESKRAGFYDEQGMTAELNPEHSVEELEAMRRLRPLRNRIRRGPLVPSEWY
jgi:hypothetical protein